MIEVAESTRRLSTRRSVGRITNAIAAMLRKQLSVPHIFLRPRIPGQSGIDVLAVDRAGSGDIHAVEVRVETLPLRGQDLLKALVPLRTLPAHFRYLAINSPDLGETVQRRLAEYEELFDPSGIGRFGVIAYDDRLLQAGVSPVPGSVAIVVQPERFLVRGEKLTLLEKYLARTRPDMEVRL